MRVSIKSLSLKNFKGVRELSVSMNGANVNISGDNATGKTTVADAFFWLLFDKDSTNRKVFSIKTRKPDGTEESGLEHSVEAVITVDGADRKLVKIYSEVWKTKRGSETAEFSGHETRYYVDEVPVSQKDYQAKVAELVPEDTFRLVTDPMYFNSVLKPDERRKVLFELMGDIADAEILQASEYEQLRAEMGSRTPDEFRKVLADRISKLSKDKDAIPARVDENQRTINSAPDFTAVKAEYEEQAKQAAELDAQLADVGKASEAYRAARMKVEQLESRLREMRSDMDYAARTAYRTAQQNEERMNAEIRQTESRKNALEQEIQRLNAFIERDEKDLTTLRDKYVSKDAETFHGSICPTCGQQLPAEELEKKQSEFNATKANALNGLKNDGVSARNRLDANKNSLEAFRKELIEVTDKIRNLKDALQSIGQVSVPENVQYEADPDYKQVLDQCEEAQQQADEMSAPDSSALLNRKREIDSRLNDLRSQLMKEGAVEEARHRITELHEQNKALAVQIQSAERLVHLLNDFTKVKARMIDERAASLFRMVTFRMFKQQINGGLDPTCEAMVAGVPFADVNHAGQINAGLDIIQTISRIRDISAPIFIDNREAVNEILPMDAQIINLIVSHDPALKVEVQK